jgi:hypothetical protein
MIIIRFRASIVKCLSPLQKLPWIRMERLSSPMVQHDKEYQDVRTIWETLDAGGNTTIAVSSPGRCQRDRDVGCHIFYVKCNKTSCMSSWRLSMQHRPGDSHLRDVHGCATGVPNIRTHSRPLLNDIRDSRDSGVRDKRSPLALIRVVG